MEHPMQKLNDLSRSLAPLDGTLIAVIEIGHTRRAKAIPK
jgi:hypothetical protein